MLGGKQAKYDQTSTIFSPEGRVFQVEYAREAVKRGTPSIGLKFKNGVVLVAHKLVTSRLVEPHAIEKIFKLDKHIGCVSSGLVADTRTLVDYARRVAQREKHRFNEPIEVESLVKRVCDIEQNYTQIGGSRPFGTAFLVVGVDRKGPQLFETDPSGAFRGHYARCIGTNKDVAHEILEADYKKNLGLNKAIGLTLRTLLETMKGDLAPYSTDIGIVTKTTEFEILPSEMVSKHMRLAFKGGD